MPLRKNNRLDILDTKMKWLEAFVIDVNERNCGLTVEDQTEIKVHFKGYTSKWDEVI